MYKRILVCFLLLGFFSPLVSTAQSSASLYLTVNPQFPEAGESYTVSARVSGNSSPRSKLVWYVDDKPLDTPDNQDSLTLTALETQSKITARAQLADGTEITASKTISPFRVDLIVDAETRVPSFFKGKSLPTSGSPFTVKALVFANGVQTTKDLSYAWKVGKTASGAVRGNNSVSYTPSFESEVLVSVDIFDARNKKIASDAIRVPIKAPEVLFYEHNPLRGLSTVALQQPHIFVGNELRIRAEAFYLNEAIKPDDLFIEWRFDGKEVAVSSEDKQEITILKEGETGNSILSFHIRDLKELLHGAQKALTIKF